MTGVCNGLILPSDVLRKDKTREALTTPRWKRAPFQADYICLRIAAAKSSGSSGVTTIVLFINLRTTEFIGFRARGPLISGEGP